MKTINKSQYWKTQTQHYDTDADGVVSLHLDAPDDVKKSYKQYQIEQSMMLFFAEEEDEVKVERTHSLNEEQTKMVNTFLENETYKTTQLKKDYSMYKWQAHHEYYDVKEGRVYFHDDAPQDILDSYQAYVSQQKKLAKMKEGKVFSFKDFISLMTQGKFK